MKTIKDYLPGKKFIYGNKRCMVLDNTLESGVLCMVLDENFHSKFGKNNNFAKSTLREKLNGEYIDKWAESGAKRKDFVKMTVDLTADDGLKDYGVCECFLAPRTCEQHGKYRYLIPNASYYEWTATAYSTESNGYISIIRGVDSDGTLISVGASIVHGVRPLFMLNHDCHFESEEKQERIQNKESNNGNCEHEFEDLYYCSDDDYSMKTEKVWVWKNKDFKVKRLVCCKKCGQVFIKDYEK